jgi:hypothetical protein
MRDFFWDDEFRAKWDDMLLHAETLEDCPTTGTMLVQWVRKVGRASALSFVSLKGSVCVGLITEFMVFLAQFPFFCSDREYIIGRRIWESGRMYYCVTKV